MDQAKSWILLYNSPMIKEHKKHIGMIALVLTTFVSILLGCNDSSQTTSDPTTNDPTLSALSLSNVELTQGVETMTLTWENPTASHFSSVTVVRGTDDFPETMEDGTMVCEGQIEICEDEEALASLRTVYYSLFITNTNGEVKLDSTESGYALGIVSSKSGLTNHAQAATFYQNTLYFAYEGNLYRIPYDENTMSLAAEETLATRSYNIIDLDPVSETVWRLGDQSNGSVRSVTFNDNTMTSVSSESVEAVALGTSMFGIVAGGGNVYAVDGEAGSGNDGGEFLQYGSEYNILYPTGNHEYRGVDYYDEKVYIGNSFAGSTSIYVFDNTLDSFSEIAQTALSDNAVVPRKVEIDDSFLYVIGQHTNGPLLVLEHDGTLVNTIEIPGTTMEMATNDNGIVFVFTTDNKVHVVRVQ
jgi:hypothetical protein